MLVSTVFLLASHFRDIQTGNLKSPAGIVLFLLLLLLFCFFNHLWMKRTSDILWTLFYISLGANSIWKFVIQKFLVQKVDLKLQNWCLYQVILLLSRIKIHWFCILLWQKYPHIGCLTWHTIRRSWPCWG